MGAALLGLPFIVVPTLPATAQPQDTAALRLVKAPPGFTRSCARYSWLCTERLREADRITGTRLLDLASQVNRAVNSSVTPLTDPENYGVAEYWTLPDNGRGDCEDYALEKYRRLLEAGVDSRDIRLAIVLDAKRMNHLVLLLRHESGDLVLDNITTEIIPWNESEYEFLAIQYGADRALWQVVMGRDRRQTLLASR